MNLTNTIATAVLAGAIALTGAQGAFAGAETANSSETNSGHAITRTERHSTSQGVTVRGDMESMYINYEDADVLAFMRMDMESAYTAEMLVDMFGDADFVASQLDMDVEGTFLVRGIGYCAGIYGDMDGVYLYIAVCADGRYVNTVMGTDKQDVLDVLTVVQEDGELVVPAGYVEEEM